MSNTKRNKLTTKDVEHVAKLAQLPISKRQMDQLTEQLDATVAYVSQLQSLDTKGVVETSQVTGLENVFREDVIDASRILNQEDALSQSSRTHNGFFVVDAVLGA